MIEKVFIITWEKKTLLAYGKYQKRLWLIDFMILKGFFFCNSMPLEICKKLQEQTALKSVKVNFHFQTKDIALLNRSYYYAYKLHICSVSGNISKF